MKPKTEHAKLIPVVNGSDEINNAIDVQFNPTTLKVSLSNTLKASNENSENKSQYIESSSSKLAIELIFDSSDSNTDVRYKTIAITREFMTPQSESNKAPKICRFVWGSFSFNGMLQDYNETLDFFAPEGIPLRATVSLNFVENRYQFTILDKKVDRNIPKLTPSSASTPVNKALLKNHHNESNWRETALYNGIESPRFPEKNVLAVPDKNSADSSSRTATGGGYSNGQSSKLGTAINGAFNS